MSDFIPYEKLEEWQKEIVDVGEVGDRCLAARRGLGRDKLAHDENWVVRQAVAASGDFLDVLATDPDANVRVAVAQQGFAWRDLARDPEWRVRCAVAERGLALDYLIRDEDEHVSNEAFDTLADAGYQETAAGVERWVAEHPDSALCMPEDHEQLVDAFLWEEETSLAEVGEQGRREIYADLARQLVGPGVAHAGDPEWSGDEDIVADTVRSWARARGLAVEEAEPELTIGQLLVGAAAVMGDGVYNLDTGLTYIFDIDREAGTYNGLFTATTPLPFLQQADGSHASAQDYALENYPMPESRERGAMGRISPDRPVALGTQWWLAEDTTLNLASEIDRDPTAWSSAAGEAIDNAIELRVLTRGGRSATENIETRENDERGSDMAVADLQRARREAGYRSAADFAAAIGANRADWSRWEETDGPRWDMPDAVARLAAVRLGVPVDSVSNIPGNRTAGGGERGDDYLSRAIADNAGRVVTLTDVTIRWHDTGEVVDRVFCDWGGHLPKELDEQVFFAGLSREKLEAAALLGDDALSDYEFSIVSVGPSRLYELDERDHAHEIDPQARAREAWDAREARQAARDGIEFRNPDGTYNVAYGDKVLRLTEHQIAPARELDSADEYLTAVEDALLAHDSTFLSELGEKSTDALLTEVARGWESSPWYGPETTENRAALLKSVVTVAVAFGGWRRDAPELLPGARAMRERMAHERWDTPIYAYNVQEHTVAGVWISNDEDAWNWARYSVGENGAVQLEDEGSWSFEMNEVGDMVEGYATCREAYHDQVAHPGDAPCSEEVFVEAQKAVERQAGVKEMKDLEGEDIKMSEDSNEVYAYNAKEGSVVGIWDSYADGPGWYVERYELQADGTWQEADGAFYTRECDDDGNQVAGYASAMEVYQDAEARDGDVLCGSEVYESITDAAYEAFKQRRESELQRAAAAVEAHEEAQAAPAYEGREGFDQVTKQGYMILASNPTYGKYSDVLAVKMTKYGPEFAIGHGYDAETGVWSQGTYCNDLPSTEWDHICGKDEPWWRSQVDRECDMEDLPKDTIVQPLPDGYAVANPDDPDCGAHGIALELYDTAGNFVSDLAYFAPCVDSDKGIIEEYALHVADVRGAKGMNLREAERFTISDVGGKALDFALDDELHEEIAGGADRLAAAFAKSQTFNSKRSEHDADKGKSKGMDDFVH